MPLPDTKLAVITWAAAHPTLTAGVTVAGGTAHITRPGGHQGREDMAAPCEPQDRKPHARSATRQRKPTPASAKGAQP